jgi:hypothetical protein
MPFQLQFRTILDRLAALACAMVLAVSLCARAGAQANLVVNPGFESVDSDNHAVGWSEPWSRDPGAIAVTMDAVDAHGGGECAQVVATGTRDWSYAQENMVPVSAGQIYELSAWIKCRQVDLTQLCVVTRDQAGNVMNWTAGLVGTSGTHDWRRIASRVLVPDRCASLQFRVIGYGGGTSWIDDTSLTRVGDIADLATHWSGRVFHLSNAVLSVSLNPETTALTVTDLRTRHVWTEFAAGGHPIVLAVKQPSRNEADLALLNETGELSFSADITVPPDSPQIRITIAGDAPLNAPLAFPLPFETHPSDQLVMPMNEGMLFPAVDSTIATQTFETFNGHGGLSMPWAGVVGAGGSGVMLLIRTPDDAQVAMDRVDNGPLFLRPEWVASLGKISYPRKLTYVFVASGGYVAQAKWYRAYAKQAGLFKTLAEKRKANPNVEKLIGAVDVWQPAWIGDADQPVALCKEMKSLGMDHVLWSAGGTPEQIRAIDALGYLTGKYDQYQDQYPPDSGAAMFPARWPADLEEQWDGSMTLGWLGDVWKNGVDTKVQAGVCNARREVEIASAVIPQDLATTPYTARFLDTDTASPWREDYNPLHPMTRSDDRLYRMKLLDLCTDKLKLVTGSETGIDAAVPYLDYFEGMMSVSEYRYPDDGRNVEKIVDPTPDILKFMVGPKYRIPLFELVYHDCVVDYWYWGDYTNKMPAVWAKRDLFNILYGTPPEFMFDAKFWAANRDHFVKTYNDVCPIVRRLGYSEMLSHVFLNADHTVQQTKWSNGTTITVNLGDSPYKPATGAEVGPMRWVVAESPRKK